MLCSLILLFEYELNVRIQVRDTTFVYFFLILVWIYSNFVYILKSTMSARAVGSHVTGLDDKSERLSWFFDDNMKNVQPIFIKIDT